MQWAVRQIQVRSICHVEPPICQKVRRLGVIVGPLALFGLAVAATPIHFAGSSPEPMAHLVLACLLAYSAIAIQLISVTCMWAVAIRAWRGRVVPTGPALWVLISSIMLIPSLGVAGVLLGLFSIEQLTRMLRMNVTREWSSIAVWMSGAR